MSGDERESELPPDWALIDTWRSIWEALAIAAGDAPDRARAAHIRYCARLASERNQTEKPA